MADRPYSEAMDILRTLSTVEIPVYLENHHLSLNNPQGFSPMHYIAGHTSRTNILRFFFQHCGGNPETAFEGKTLLETACLVNGEAIIYLLLSVLPCYQLEQEKRVVQTLTVLPPPLREKAATAWSQRVSHTRRLAFLFVTSKQVLRLPPGLLRECVLYL